MEFLQYIIAIFAMVAAGVVANHTPDSVRKDYQGKAILDPKGNYQLEWRVEWDKRRITLNITVITNGYVGFGLSPDGTMKDADIVVAGVGPDGKPYLSDLHTDCHRNYKPDIKQDYTLLGYAAADGVTIVQVSRALDTCDPEDFPITDSLTRVIWAFGESDVLDYHNHNRGMYRIYFLDPVMHPPVSQESMPRWLIKKRVEIKPQETSYWCTVHKTPPSITTKQHMVQFSGMFENELAKTHVHHHVIYRCGFQPGQDVHGTMEPLLYPHYPGEECYLNPETPHIPINNCREVVYFWSLGGQTMILPEEVGLALEPGEYYMLETHYNNPEKLSGITFETGVEVVFTDQLRPNEGGAFFVAYNLLGLFMIPPGTEEFQVHAFCGPKCTQSMIPAEGIEIYAVHLHSHCTAKKMTLQHFRNGVELPWIMSDTSYDVTFQQPRPLYTKRKALAGDQFVMSCTYENALTTTNFQGLAAKNKMCVALVYITNKIDYSLCASQIPPEILLPLVGVNNITWDLPTQERIVTSPEQYQGLTLQSVCDDKVAWTSQLRGVLASVTATTPQPYVCPLDIPPVEPDTSSSTPPVAGYPFYDSRFSRSRNCPSPGSNSYANTGTTSYNSRARGGRGGHH